MHGHYLTFHSYKYDLYNRRRRMALSIIPFV